MIRRVVRGLGLLLLPLTVQAQPLLVQWEFPRAYTPAPSSFRLLYTTSATPTAEVEAMTVVPSAPGACTMAPGATPQTYCAAWPTCPAPGTVMVVWVQAVWGADDIGPGSNIVICEFSAERPCTCLNPAREVPVSRLPQAALTALHHETQPQHWTDALATILGAVPVAGT